ncbi:P-selectin glycoprotein ligand 1 [Morone saxatilis]|uniref:P-selectin glycoprotein ligand 1 n=1 Tax=Morone saxatilis TaxID=34816 RepID=UPI0015E238DD|nr:P-selectin glycoprotein ligand 1 [Morone saxatilis]XP_035524550.1 P-selectin glycoprotein ligand 1 [Morone saxatilis]
MHHVRFTSSKVFGTTMMLLSMNTYLALLWGMFVLLSTESMSASIPVTSRINTTPEPNMTTKQLSSISAHVVHKETETQPATRQPTHKPAEASATANTVSPLTPTIETEEATVTESSNDITADLVAMNTAAETTNSSRPRLLDISTAVSTAAGEPSLSTTISETAKPTEGQLHQQSPTTPTDMNSSSAGTSAVSLSTETVSLPQPTSTKPEVTFEVSSATSPASTQTPVFIKNLSRSSAITTTTMTENPSSEAAPVFDSTSMPFTVSETTTSTELSSTSQPMSVMRTHISTSANPASEAAPVSDSTSIPLTVSETTTSTELSSMSQPVSVTRTHVATSDVTDTSSTSESPTFLFSNDSATSTATAASTSPRRDPHAPTTSLISTNKSTLATTTAPCEASKSPLEVQPCSSRGVVKHCLITIAALAGLATVFMVSTIVLCTKLSARKYKVKKPSQSTEMICISALLPERNHTYTRQRNPVPNGVLVIHHGGDSDEDGGDNLTLSSFLPENDRYV